MDANLRRKILEGAEIVAKEAKRIAASFSRRTAAATHVAEDSKGIMVETLSSQAPMARPFQDGLRHPLFGDREHWYTQPYHPYMSLAWEIKKRDMEQKMAEWVEEEWQRRMR